MVQFVCDAVNLEEINYSLDEVQSILEGLTVAGHQQSDQIITLNQANAWHFLFDALNDGTFEMTNFMKSCLDLKIVDIMSE